MSGSDADRSFADVRAQLDAFEAAWATWVAARNLWVRALPDDASGAGYEVEALPVGTRPADPAFVPIPPPSAGGVADVTLPLTAAALAYLLPVAVEPARLAARVAVLRVEFALVLEHAAAIAQRLATEGLAGPTDGGVE